MISPTDLSMPLQHQPLDLQLRLLVGEHGEQVDHREPPRKDNECLAETILEFTSLMTISLFAFSHLESRDGDAQQLELLRELEDGEQNGAEEGDLQEAEHDQPRKQEVTHSPAARERKREEME